jgi:primary-amine oxidase
VADPAGRPVTFPNAVCVHEEDANVLWRHFDASRGKTEVRRSRRLVISCWATVGNYDYGFFWYLYQDGAIEAEVKMTGIVTTGALSPSTAEPYLYGQRLSSDGLYAPIHQHFFSFRLDLDIDGTANVLEEVEGQAVPTGSENPTGALFVSRATPLRRESEAQRLANPATGRCWVVRNPTVRNHLGEPVGYRLVPKGGLLPFATPEASVGKRAGFMFKHLWATPYRSAERYAAGDYPNLHPGGAGLPAWTAADRSLENEDLVLWYTVGSHHPVRPEDWPIMPVQCVGFRLEPSGFFDRNPALDVPT